MFVEAVSNLDDNVVEEKESKETSDAKELVFDKVKNLFQITSNKKHIIKNYVSKLKEIHLKLKKIDIIEKKLEEARKASTNEINELSSKFEKSKNLLESSLGD